MIQTGLHLTAAALLAFVIGAPTPITLVFALFLALLPDIDTPKSLVGRMLKPISVSLERRVGHRTATHSVAALLLVAGVTYLLFPDSWMVLAGAYASHLLLDLLIGVQGITLFWPSSRFLTLTGWRDNSPAPRLLLGLLVPAMLLAALWPQIGPALTRPITAAIAVANPIATPSPTKSPPPSIRLRLTLPPGTGLSALRVRSGDAIREGQTLAAWTVAVPTPHPSATPPPMPTPPSVPAMPFADSSASRALRDALDAQDHMRTAQGLERQQAEAGVAAAQADLDALPTQQRQALARLDADHSAAKILATARVASARGQAEDARRAQEHEAQLAASTATMAVSAHHSASTATAAAHQAAVTATAGAAPTPIPNHIVSRAAGTIVGITAEEQDGQLVVTLEVRP